jgi:hypothetical protein
MTILEKFVEFAERLPDDRRQEIEELLADLMAGESIASEFSADELAELERRMADPNPKYADPKDIAAIFGTTFGA